MGIFLSILIIVISYITVFYRVSPFINSNHNLKKGRTAFTFLPRSPAVDTIQSQRCPSLKLKPSSNETYDVPKQQIYHQKLPKICVFYADISSVYYESMNNRINQVAKLWENIKEDKEDLK